MEVLWTLSLADGKVVGKSYNLAEVDEWFLRIISLGHEPPVIGVEGATWSA